MSAFRKPRSLPAAIQTIAPAGEQMTVTMNTTTNLETPIMSFANTAPHTAGWVTFSYASFAISCGMMALGIWALPADLWVKGYLMMASVFMLGSCFTLAKTVRDEHEAKRFTNRIEDAKAERLLMEVGRGV